MGFDCSESGINCSYNENVEHVGKSFDQTRNKNGYFNVIERHKMKVFINIGIDDDTQELHVHHSDGTVQTLTFEYGSTVVDIDAGASLIFQAPPNTAPVNPV